MRTIHRMRCGAAAALLVATLASPSIATGQSFTFDEECAPLSENNLAIAQPNALIILDRSGSMREGSGEDVDGGGEDSKLKVARLAIQDVAVANHVPGACPMVGNPSCDDFRLGLGYYSSNSEDDSPDELDSYVAVAPGEDNRAAIVADVGGVTAPGGSGTTTGDAATRIERDMTDDTRPNLGIIITDGATTGSNQQRKAVEALCEARDRSVAPVTTIIVGFGDGSDEEENSLLAAAGGSGMCCDDTEPPCAAEDQVDPCDFDPNSIYTSGNSRLRTDWECSGSLEADGSALKDAILEALDSVRCTFTLDVPETYPTAPSAMDDPASVQVRISHAVLAAGLLDVPNVDPDAPMSDFAEYLEVTWGVDPTVAAGYANEGWYFSDATRTRVTLTEKLCQDARGGDVPVVTTQVACYCVLTGEPCTVTEGYEGFTNEQIEAMRCTNGVYECIDGRDVCVGNEDPLPEICNGIDDNCDGTTDNLDSGQMEWEDWEAMGDNSANATHCNFRNICVCPGGARDEPVATGASLQEHVDSWSGSCLCAEGLESAAPSQPRADSPVHHHDEPTTSCATGAGSGTAAAFLGVLGFIGFANTRRRRRRS